MALIPIPANVLAYFANGRTQGRAAPVGDEIREGDRHRQFVSLAGSMRRRGMSFDAIAAALREENRKCRNEQGDPAPMPDEELVELVEDVVRRYQPAPPDPERERLEREADRLFAEWDGEPDGSRTGREKSEKSEKRVGEEDLSRFSRFSRWGDAWVPPDLDPAALHGPAGEYALDVQPYTEASPAAILVCGLIAFGNVAHRGPRLQVGGTTHRVNEFGLLVGPTSIGRKGEAMQIGKRPLVRIDEGWATVSVSRGFGSGEAIVEAVRDKVTELDENGDERIVDPGASDKRLLVNEEEFAHVLAVASREGSTLSALIRSAWDGHRLENRTKRRLLLATDAHVSLLAGITPTELIAKTTELDAANGLLNRFLLVASRRAHTLPRPARIHPAFDDEWSARFATALRFVHQELGDGSIDYDDDAAALWDRAYVDELSVERHGLAGAVCSRAEAHTLRLAMLYALLDCSSVIRCEHLEAALALWRYCEASARLVFGDRLGDQIADGIIEALRGSENGLTRNEIGRLFSGHRVKGEIDAALSLLVGIGLVVVETKTTSGRPVTRVRLVDRETNR